jgi:CubicO group peptidase (beta-lactamase class C family)
MSGNFASVGKAIAIASVYFATLGCATSPQVPTRPKLQVNSINTIITASMAATGSKGLAIAVIENGQVAFTKSYGVRNQAGDPLQNDTIMYGASLTKAAFAIFVMQLVDEGKLNLDTPIGDFLPQPLPSYSSAADANAYVPWAGLAGDERWRKITPRILLTHSSGFHNFAFLEPDGVLKIHFEPGSRYAYSGAGILLLQFVIERGLGLNVGEEMSKRIFAVQGMTRTSLIWRPDFRPNLADGFGMDGSVEEHDERSKVRASGSMDTTIADIGKLVASFARGDGLSTASRADMIRPQLAINTKSQFPSFQEPNATPVFPTLSSGLGVITFSGPQGGGFYKGGHNDTTANTWVCVERGKRCVVILSNDVRSEAAFPAIVHAVLGETGVPWAWEYGDMKFWTPASE